MSSDYDSDAVDSDTEIKLWSRIYHEPSKAEAHECTLQTYWQLLGRDSSNSPATSSSAQSSASSVPLQEASTRQKNCSDHVIECKSSTLDGYHDASSDSDDEPSKSQLMSGLRIKKRMPKPLPSIRFIDIASSDDSSDDDIVILSDTTNSLVPDVVNIVPSPPRAKRLNSSPTKAEIALNAFLARCRPDYSPRNGDINNNHKDPDAQERKAMKNKRHSGAVSLDLLNSLPGNSNKFKRIRKNSEEADLWRVDAEDLPGYKSSEKKKDKRRYYSQMKRCELCKEFTDHVSRDCPRGPGEPICIICGISGHTAESCDRKFCTNCCLYGHRSSNCHKSFMSNICDSCNLKGHLSSNCPNIWRKYHATTSHSTGEPTVIANVTVNRRVFCCQCGGHGHFAFECIRYFHGRPKVYSSPLLYATSKMQSNFHLPPPARRRDSQVQQLNGKRKYFDDPIDYQPSAAKRPRQLLKGRVPTANATVTSDTQLDTVISDKGKLKKMRRKQKKSDQRNKSNNSRDRNNAEMRIETNSMDPLTSKSILHSNLSRFQQSNQSSAGEPSTSAAISVPNANLATATGKKGKSRKTKKEKREQLALALATTTQQEPKPTSEQKPEKKKRKKRNLKQPSNNSHASVAQDRSTSPARNKSNKPNHVTNLPPACSSSSSLPSSSMSAKEQNFKSIVSNGYKWNHANNSHRQPSGVSRKSPLVKIKREKLG